MPERSPDPSTEALKRVKDATRRTRASYVEGTPEKYPRTPLGGARLTDVERLLSDFGALAARLSQAEEESNRYRIEADCAMRDYDGLELTCGRLRDAVRVYLVEIGRAPNNRNEDAIASASEELVAALAASSAGETPE